MKLFSSIRYFLTGHDASIDLNDYNAVKKALSILQWRIPLFAISTYLSCVMIGSKVSVVLAFIIGAPLFFLFLVLSFISYDRLIRSNAMSCDNCGLSLVSNWGPITVYYQCKRCGAKPGEILRD